MPKADYTCLGRNRQIEIDTPCTNKKRARFTPNPFGSFDLELHSRHKGQANGTRPGVRADDRADAGEYAFDGVQLCAGFFQR